jgi:hypothetical protein
VHFVRERVHRVPPRARGLRQALELAVVDGRSLAGPANVNRTILLANGHGGAQGLPGVSPRRARTRIERSLARHLTHSCGRTRW